MKRNVLFIFFMMILQIKIWSVEFVLSNSSKEILSRTDDYNAVQFCFLENNLVIFDFCRSEIFLNNEWQPLFEIQYDGDAIELSQKYGVSTSPFIDYEKKHLFIEITDRNNMANYFCYEFVIKNNELLKYSHTRKEFLQIKESLYDFWQDYPIRLADNSEIQFFSKVINLKTYDYQIFFQAEKNKQVVFNFLDSILGYRTLTRPYINEKRNKIVILGCNKEPSSLENDCRVFLFSIIFDAIINDNDVRLRSEPNLSCKTFRYLNRGYEIKIYDRSNEKFIVEEEEWYWYKVITQDGITGWVYGKYLDIL